MDLKARAERTIEIMARKAEEAREAERRLADGKPCGICLACQNNAWAKAEALEEAQEECEASPGWYVGDIEKIDRHVAYLRELIDSGDGDSLHRYYHGNVTGYPMVTVEYP